MQVVLLLFYSILHGTNGCIQIHTLNSNLPKLDDFLPYTQWPPMILYTGKTRFELMIEEEADGKSNIILAPWSLALWTLVYTPWTNS